MVSVKMTKPIKKGVWPKTDRDGVKYYVQLNLAKTTEILCHYTSANLYSFLAKDKKVCLMQMSKQIERYQL